MSRLGKEREQDRRARARLRVIRHYEQVTQNVSQTCRFFGISRTIFYCWLARYRLAGIDGLRERQRGPRHHPYATPPPSSP